MKMFSALFLIIIINIFKNANSHPVALFHGIGDACNFAPLIQLTNYLKEKLNTEVKCIEIGNGFVSSWFMQFSKQAEEACEKIKSDEAFQNNFSVVGISQGSLIARYIVQKCEIKGQVVNFVAINGPQMGIGSLPKITCPVVCPIINKIVAPWVYTDYFQKNLGPAGYYKDKFLYDMFLSKSTFLADLNNEREEKNQEYKRRFSNLNKALFIKSREDTVITPRESSHLEFFDKEGEKIVPLRESKFYLEDFIGVKHLDDNNKLLLKEIDGDHVQFTYNDIDEIVIPVLLEGR